MTTSPTSPELTIILRKCLVELLLSQTSIKKVVISITGMLF
ncbi:hypothetical protein [Candidatus Tisiphia endosymbiont of Sialis lutaria]